MGNRRAILFLLSCIGACALLLWGVQRRSRFFPTEAKTAAVLFETPLEGVERLSVERADTRIELRRQAGRWALCAPFSASVDQGVVAKLLDAFEHASVVDSLSFAEIRRRELSLKEFGLAPASACVRFSGAQLRDEIWFGALSPLKTEVYARMNNLEQVLVLPAELSAALPRTADDLRSRKLLHRDRSLVRTLEIRSQGRPFVKLSRETGTWWLVQPAVAPASDERVESLLDALYGARVGRFVWPTVSNVMDVAEADSALKARMDLYGLGVDAAVQIHVQDSISSATSKIVFGRPVDESGALHYVMAQEGEMIGVVSGSVAKCFCVAPSDLRDTQLFFTKPDNLHKLQIQYGDLLFVLSQTNDVWRLQTPVSDEADQAVVKGALDQLMRLRAEKIIDDVSQETKTTGVERSPPVSYVELAAGQSVLSFSIAAGDFEGNTYRIAFTNSPAVFVVASSNVPPALVSMVGLLGLRDKSVFSVPVASVRRISVRRAGEGESALQLLRESGSTTWRLGESAKGVLDAAALDAWLARACALKADRVEKLGLSLEDIDAYGFRSPWLEVSLDVDTADAVRKTLLIGKDAGFGKRYAMVRGLDVLFVLDGAALRDLAVQLVSPL